MRPGPCPAGYGVGSGVVTAGGGGQAAAGMQTATCAGAVRVVMARPAAGNAWQVLVFRSRCRWRSMTIRCLPRPRTVSRCRALVIGAGRLAGAAPDRGLARAARGAGGDEVARGRTSLPARRALRAAAAARRGRRAGPRARYVQWLPSGRKPPVRGSAMSLLTRISTCVPVASIRETRSAPGTEVPVQDPQAVIGEHAGVPGEHRIQQRLLALGLGPAGGAGDDRQVAAGGGVGGEQVTDLRVRRRVISGPGRPERLPVRGSIGNSRHRPVDRAQPQLMTPPAHMYGPAVMITALWAHRRPRPGRPA